MSVLSLPLCRTGQMHPYTTVSHIVSTRETQLSTACLTISTCMFDRAVQPYTTVSLPGEHSHALQHVSQSLPVCLTGHCSYTRLCLYQGNAAMHYNMSHNLYLYVLQGTAAIRDCMSQSLHVRLTGKCSHILPYISQTYL